MPSKVQNANASLTRPEGALKRPKQKRSEATVAAILEASIEILSVDGGSDFNTNRVSRRAGVSIGTLYQYFKDREAILLELSRRHFSAMSNVLSSLLEPAADRSLEDSIRQLVRATIELHAQNPRLHDALSRVLASKQAEEEDGSRSFKALMADLYRRHRTEINVADADLAAFMTYEIVEHLVHRVIAHAAHSMTPAALEDEIFRIVFAYLQGSWSAS